MTSNKPKHPKGCRVKDSNLAPDDGKLNKRKEVETMKKELNVYEDFIAQLIYKFQNHIDGVKYRNDIFPNLRDIHWIRINRCQAWFTRIDDLVFIKSYSTIVAVFDGDTLYSNGRYSNTTYQHIRKFRNNYTPDMCKTKEVNLERVNWY